MRRVRNAIIFCIIIIVYLAVLFIDVLLFLFFWFDVFVFVIYFLLNHLYYSPGFVVVVLEQRQASPAVASYIDTELDTNMSHCGLKDRSRFFKHSARLT